MSDAGPRPGPDSLPARAGALTIATLVAVILLLLIGLFLIADSMGFQRDPNLAYFYAAWTAAALATLGIATLAVRAGRSQRGVTRAPVIQWVRTLALPLIAILTLYGASSTLYYLGR